ncbi:MAG TPA: DUF423 domain-containing protein [Steroidobacteraceae bacterium]|nr:DUF423 domain-containing protein [Steroidobacteraceae bacterium]
MTAVASRIGALAAILLALATIVGALGAHALKGRLGADQYDVLQTAVHYQFFHSLGLLGLALLLDRLPSPTLGVAAWLLFAGIVLFSGSLYALIAGAPRLIGVLTPLGGLALIVSWCLVALVLIRGSAGR